MDELEHENTILGIFFRKIEFINFYQNGRIRAWKYNFRNFTIFLSSLFWSSPGKTRECQRFTNLPDFREHISQGCSHVANGSHTGRFILDFMDPTRSSGQVSGGILDLAKKEERSIQYYVDMADDLGSIGLWIQLHKNGDEWRLKAKSRLPTSTLVNLDLQVELFFADDSYRYVSKNLFVNIVSKKISTIFSFSSFYNFR